MRNWRGTAFARIKEVLIAESGLAYYRDRNDDLAGRLVSRLQERGVRDWESYLKLLEDEGEREAAFAALTIGETFFFRHTELFEGLRRVVLPDLLQRKRATRRLRVWSAGCASGAEVYSLSILLRSEFAEQLKGWELSILGTDINQSYLTQARQGEYQDWALRGVRDEVKRDCFERRGERWRIAPRFRESVSFQYHNLVRRPFPSLAENLAAFDLILCRNVMIYFAQEVMARLVGQFHQSLLAGGWLLVGHAEPNMEMFSPFHMEVVPGAILYQKPLLAAQAAPVLGQLAPVPILPPSPLTRSAPSIAGAVPPLVEAPGKEIEEGVEQVRHLADRGEWEEAEARCRRLLEKRPLQVVVHFYLGLVLEQVGRAREAEMAFRRCLYLDRRFLMGHYHLGLFQQRQNHLVEARRSFRNVLHLVREVDGEAPCAEGDGLRAGDLAGLARMHLEVLRWQKN